jgi:hypothetical protein
MSLVDVDGPLFLLIAKPVNLSLTFCAYTVGDGTNRPTAIAAAASTSRSRDKACIFIDLSSRR